jgi:hypothetical protein
MISSEPILLMLDFVMPGFCGAATRDRAGLMA